MFKKDTAAKKSHPLLTLTVGTLSAIGAYRVVHSVKSMSCRMMERMHRWFGKKKEDMETISEIDS